MRPLYRAGQRDTCTVRSQPVNYWIRLKTCANGLASNDLHLMLIFVTTPIFLYKEWPLFIFLHFRRSYKVTLPFSVTSSYLLRKFNFNAYFCNDPHLLIWNLTPALICYILRSHIVTLPVVAKPSILARKLLYWWGSWQMNCVLHVMLTLTITLISWYESWPLFLFHVFCRSYVVTSLSIIKNIDSTEVALMLVILTKIEYCL